MAKVKVTTIANHFGSNGMKNVGDVYEVEESIAEVLKRNLLVEFNGRAAEPEKSEHIFIGKEKKESQSFPKKKK
jgi:hypothetical protein